MGLGTWPLTDKQVAPLIVTAIEAGYRHLDTETSIVPAVNPERIRQNIDLFDFSLEPTDVDAISALGQGPDAGVDWT